MTLRVRHGHRGRRAEPHTTPRSAARYAAHQCSSGKLGFDQRNVARTEAARLGHQQRKEYAIYRCRECRRFHLTSRWAEGVTTNGTRRKAS